MTNSLFEYVLRAGDSNLILGHRLSEWTAHGPVLEQDIALTNVALDLIGQATMFLEYAAELEGKGRTADEIAFLRDAPAYRNVLLTEQPNEDFGYTIVRQFFYDTYNYLFYKELCKSTDERLKGIAEKSVKEATYHIRHSREWVLRLGDGTEESHRRTQNAVNDLWSYTGELFEMNETDKELSGKGIAVDRNAIKAEWDKIVTDVMTEATLELPKGAYMYSGSQKGQHSEHLGYLLAEMQYLPRAYPGTSW
jgi:ring-1,2-phenylacetyl-CoA epoxidase subunit PaaC